MRIQWPRLQDNQSTCSPSLGFLVVWETENPNTLGNSFSKLFTMVLLPTPEGPQMTRGRMGLAGAILDKPDVDVKNEAVTDVYRDWVRLPIFKPNKRPKDLTALVTIFMLSTLFETALGSKNNFNRSYAKQTLQRWRMNKVVVVGNLPEI